MNNSGLPYKELSLLVLGKKMYSVVFGNWTNPERVIFMFSGNLKAWLSNINNDLQSISSLDETKATKLVELAPPGDAYIFFNRLGYQYSDPTPELFFIEDIPNFNDAIRNIMMEAIEQTPKKIINFGHSCGGMLLLIDMILGSENSIDPINTRTDSNFLLLNDRKNYHWIMLDPFLPNKVFVLDAIKNIGRAYSVSFIENIVNIFSIRSFNFFSSLCIISKNTSKFGFFMRLFAEYCKQILRSGADILNFVTNNCQNFLLRIFKINPNFLELMDSFSFYRQKNCLSLLEKSKGKFELHVVGISTSPIIKNHPPGLATSLSSENQMKDIANLSKYSNSYLQIAGYHSYIGTMDDGGRMFKEIIQFAYNNQQNNS